MNNFTLEKIKEFSDIQFAEPYNKPKEELLLDLEGFICEEMSELIRDRSDKVKVIDALADIVYFTADIGFACDCDLPIDFDGWKISNDFVYFRGVVFDSVRKIIRHEIDGLFNLITACGAYAKNIGVELMPILEIVHNANMAKFFNEKGEFDVLRRKEDGKILKPKHWQEKHAPEAKIEAEIKRQLELKK